MSKGEDLSDVPGVGAAASGESPEEPLGALRARILKLVDAYLKRLENDGFEVLDPQIVARTFQELAARAVAHPDKLLRRQSAFWADMQTLFERTGRRLATNEPAEPVVAPARGDKRFQSALWSEDPLFDWLKQVYLLTAHHLESAVEDIDGIDPPTRRKAQFYLRQFVDALSPANFPATNPEILKTIGQSGAEGLMRGFDRLLEDMEESGGRLRPPMCDKEAFRVGETLAATPGAVIYANELMQLIQYAPATESVHERPLLIVPPWINKYYVLDLRPTNSFVAHAVAQGHTVFMISWVNPGPEHAGQTFADYMHKGPLAALDAIAAATGAREVNVAGYCIGGTLTAATLACMAATGDDRVSSVTLIATLLDFSDPGEISVFIDDEQLTRLEAHMQRHGYLDGRHMADAFAYLRDKELIWSSYVSGYLHGRPPPAFDLLYWNADTTRMPAAMHSFYLRNMYQRNLLREPGGIVLGGVPVDLRSVRVPAYFLSTREDHIAPWHSTYAGARLFTGPVRFVLGGSGHVAGVINPPGARKYGYWTNDRLADDPETWLDGAGFHDGSWWVDWAAWLSARGGPQVAPRQPGAGGLAIIEPAPGSYVRNANSAGG